MGDTKADTDAKRKAQNFHANLRVLTRGRSGASFGPNDSCAYSHRLTLSSLNCCVKRDLTLRLACFHDFSVQLLDPVHNRVFALLPTSRRQS